MISSSSTLMIRWKSYFYGDSDFALYTWTLCDLTKQLSMYSQDLVAMRMLRFLPIQAFPLLMSWHTFEARVTYASKSLAFAWPTR